MKYVVFVCYRLLVTLETIQELLSTVREGLPEARDNPVYQAYCRHLLVKTQPNIPSEVSKTL